MSTKLKELLKERGVKVHELADSIGVSASYIYKIIAGERNPTMIQAKKIADFLGTTIDCLFFGCGFDVSSKSDQSAQPEHQLRIRQPDPPAPAA